MNEWCGQHAAALPPRIEACELQALEFSPLPPPPPSEIHVHVHC